MKTQSDRNYYNYLEFRAHHSSQNQNPLSIDNDVTIFHCFPFSLSAELKCFQCVYNCLTISRFLFVVAKENKDEKLTVR